MVSLTLILNRGQSSSYELISLLTNGSTSQSRLDMIKNTQINSNLTNFHKRIFLNKTAIQQSY